MGAGPQAGKGVSAVPPGAIRCNPLPTPRASKLQPPGSMGARDARRPRNNVHRPNGQGATTVITGKTPRIVDANGSAHPMPRDPNPWGKLDSAHAQPTTGQTLRANIRNQQRPTIELSDSRPAVITPVTPDNQSASPKPATLELRSGAVVRSSDLVRPSQFNCEHRQL